MIVPNTCEILVQLNLAQYFLYHYSSQGLTPFWHGQFRALKFNLGPLTASLSFSLSLGLTCKEIGLWQIQLWLMCTKDHWERPCPMSSRSSLSQCAALQQITHWGLWSAGFSTGGHHIQHIWDSASRAADRRLIGPHRSSLTDNWNIVNGISLVQRPSKSTEHSLT